MNFIRIDLVLMKSINVQVDSIIDGSNKLCIDMNFKKQLPSAFEWIINMQDFIPHLVPFLFAAEIFIPVVKRESSIPTACPSKNGIRFRCTYVGVQSTESPICDVE